MNATESSGFVTSPELGPPPIAHFDDGDPVKRDPALSKLPSPSKTASDDQDLSSEPGFANLETRRKRRESTFAKDAEETGHVPETPALKPSVKVNTPAPSQILKIGAKRKLSVRDDGDQENPSKAKSSENDGFLYTRKSSAPSTKDQPTRKVSQEKSTLNAKRDKPREVSASLSTARKALGESKSSLSTNNIFVLTTPIESVNTDPVTSPVKSKPGLAEKAGDPKKEIKKSHNRPKRETPVVRPITPLESRSTTPSELPPVTPGAPGLDLSTPTKTDPSTNRQESRDTPPPDDLNVRPSRRQRSAVSYAEPSLRDKMRRPTKDLVDAVGADVKFVRAAANPEAQSKSFTDRSSRSVSVKKESDSSESTDWKNLPLRTEPTSPLGKKSSPLDENDDLPASILAGDRRRRASAMYHSEDTNSASNTAIAALVLAGSQKRLSRARQSAAVARANGFDGDGIDLSELHHALPDVEEPKVNSLTKLQRTSRRHSSLADLGKINAEKEREMGKLNMERELGKEKVKPAQVLARAQGRADITRSGRVTPDSEDGSVNGRVGMRRKSMMV